MAHNHGTISEQLDPLFNPKVVALIGASRDPISVSGFISKNLMNEGFKGKIYLVNPNARSKIMGLETVNRLGQVNDPIDCAIFTIPAKDVLGAMEECVSQKVKTAIVISAGFGEVGEAGSNMEHELVRIARKGGIRFTGPNCNGVYSAPPKFAGLFGPLRPLPGEIALVTQGGSPGVVIHNLTHCRRRGLSRFVNVGDAADLDISDFIKYYGEDSSTKAIMCYFEGLKDGRKFMEAVKHASETKPVIVMKGGTGETSQRVVASHVGALAGSDRVVSAALRSSGAIRTDSLSRMFDIAIAFSTQPLPRGNRVGILTFGGGVAVQFMDQADRLSLSVPALDSESINALNRLLPAYWSHGNPVDTTDGAVTENVVQICAQTLMKLEYVDILVVIGIGTMEGFTWLTGIKEIAKMGTDREINVAKLLAEMRSKYGKPVIGITIHANEGSEVLKYLREDSGIPMYDEPQTAALALRAMLDYKDYLNRISKLTSAKTPLKKKL